MYMGQPQTWQPLGSEDPDNCRILQEERLSKKKNARDLSVPCAQPPLLAPEQFAELPTSQGSIRFRD